MTKEELTYLLIRHIQAPDKMGDAVHQPEKGVTIVGVLEYIDMNGFRLQRKPRRTGYRGPNEWD